MPSYLICPSCKHRVYNLVCKTCGLSWKSVKDFHQYWKEDYYRRCMSFLMGKLTAANLYDAIEALHIAYQQAEKAEK